MGKFPLERKYECSSHDVLFRLDGRNNIYKEYRKGNAVGLELIQQMYIEVLLNASHYARSK